MSLRVSHADLGEWPREPPPHLPAFARSLASGASEAEDLLQEVWWRAAVHASARAPGVPLRAWLVAVTVNVGRDHLRRERRRRLLMAFWGGGEAAATPPTTPVHEGTRLWRAVASLPALQRDVLILRVVEELSITETAAALGRAEGTIKASLHRALMRLRAHFDEEGRWIPVTTPATPS